MFWATPGSMSNRGDYVTGPLRGSDLGWVNTVCVSTNLPDSSTSSPLTHRRPGCVIFSKMLNALVMHSGPKKTVRDARRSWSGSRISLGHGNDKESWILTSKLLGLVPIYANESVTDDRHSKNTFWGRTVRTLCRTLCTIQNLSPCFSLGSVAHNVLRPVQVFENENNEYDQSELKILSYSLP